MEPKLTGQPGPATEATTLWLTADAHGHLRLEEIAVGLPGPGELRVRLTACGVCPAEASVWAAHRLRPGPLGRQAVGRIESIGASGGPVTNTTGVPWRVGQRVFVPARSSCGNCSLCRADQPVQCPAGRRLGVLPGAIGQRATVIEPVSRTGILALPTELPDAAATLIEPLASVERAWTRAGRTNAAGRRLGTVLVMGLGLTGMLHAAVAAVRGASCVVVADHVPHRLMAASRLIAAVTPTGSPVVEAVNVETEDLAERVRMITDGAGAEVVVVGPGSSAAMELGTACVGVGGTLILFSPLPGRERWAMPVAELFFHEVRVVMSFWAGRADREAALVDLVGPLAAASDLLITHRLPLREYRTGFRLAAESADALQVVLLP